MKKFIYFIMLAIMSMCLCSCEKEMIPIYADKLNEGTYSVEVKSSSSMFRIIDCQLTVENGEMSAVMTLSGTGYEKLFVGTGIEADKASDGDYSYFMETDEGKYCYNIPVEALDIEFDCAGFSIRKQQWYDRTIIFKSETLPDGALKSNPVSVIMILTAVIIAFTAISIVRFSRRKENG